MGARGCESVAAKILCSGKNFRFGDLFEVEWKFWVWAKFYVQAKILGSGENVTFYILRFTF